MDTSLFSFVTFIDKSSPKLYMKFHYIMLPFFWKIDKFIDGSYTKIQIKKEYNWNTLV